MSGEIPATLRSEATLHHLLIREGFCSDTEAVAWADGWILRLDNPPDELIEISLSGGNPNEILSALGRLALPRMGREEFGLVAQYLLSRLEEDPDFLSPAAALLWRVHYDSFHGIRPLEFEPSVGLCWFHEWDNLIPDGYEDMTLDELRGRLTEFLRAYAPPDSATA